MTKNLFSTLFVWVTVAFLSLGSLFSHADLIPIGFETLLPEVGEERVVLLLAKAQSVYQLAVIPEQPGEEVALDQYEQRIDCASPKPLLRKILNHTFEWCKSQGKESCPFYVKEKLFFSTAVLVEDQYHILTVNHAFRPVIDDSLLMPPADLAPTPVQRSPRNVTIVLFNQQGDVIYDSRSYSNPTRIVLESLSDCAWNTKPPDYRLASHDRVKIELAGPISGHPLEFAANEPQLGDWVFLMGYTGVSPHPPENNRVLFGSVGEIKSANDFFEWIHFVPKVDEWQTVEQGQYFSKLSATKGLSGGPLLNKQGQVISVLSMFFSSDSETDQVFASFPRLKW